ncbi:MAG: LysM peptidoglycan-binding domain-containing protein [Planctomycetia bacterium]
MGRETKFLLAVLAALTGAFVGVLSMKLLVPRPPAGAGPDVEVPQEFAGGQDLVEPPSLGQRSLPASAFAAAPESVPAARPDAAPPDAMPPVATPPRDPFVARTAFGPAAVEADDPAPQPEAPPSEIATRPAEFVPAFDARPIEPVEKMPAPPVAAPSRYTAVESDVAVERPVPERSAGPIAGEHIVQPGDSWWSLAERAYGDGRLYRAIFAWNKALDPRVALTPGTRLEIPPAAKLQAAWPRLMPK